MKTQKTIAFALLALFVMALPVNAAEKAKKKAVAKALQFKMKSIDGKEVNLAKYQGKVILIVNVASK